MASTSQPLWVVTTYYNPARYRTRIDNFKAFRKNLSAPLLVVELGNKKQWQLTQEDGDIVIHLEGDDRIWQKERLLNICVSQLPNHVEYVAWIDCDVILEDEDWARKAIDKISMKGGMVQLFETSVHLPPIHDMGDISPSSCIEYAPVMLGRSISSTVSDNSFSKLEAELIKSHANRNLDVKDECANLHNCYGLAWASHRNSIASTGFYDRNIIGGGDAVMIFAALSGLEQYWTSRMISVAQKRDMLSWADKAKESNLLSQIISLEHRLFHLWHGDLTDRNYLGRYNIPYRNNFDPSKDIRHSGNGTWEWTNPHGPIARDVAEYFFSRREDLK